MDARLKISATAELGKNSPESHDEARLDITTSHQARLILTLKLGLIRLDA